MKKCPFCAEEIQEEAVVCRFCRRDLPSSKGAQPAISNIQLLNRWLGLGAIAMFVGICAYPLADVGPGWVVAVGWLGVWIGIARALPGSGVVKWGGGFIGSLVAVIGVFTFGTSTGLVVFRENPKPATTSAYSAPSARRDAQRQPGTGLTLANYSRLTEGMTYEQAVSILGEHGQELSRSTIAGTTTVMYQWSRWSGANMNAMFQDGRLISKAQFGLQ